MDTDSDEAGPSVPVPAKQSRLNKEPVIYLSTCDFRKVLESDSFVDKSLLIKTVLSSEDSFLVTAPRKFGKSVNANMLKRFLCIEVDKSGNRITKSKENQPVCDTENYKLFSENIAKLPERKLKIAEEEKVIKEHLGKYPVIHADFRCHFVRSFENVLEDFRKIVHEVYIEHSYLCASLELDASEKNECRKWCSKSEYELFIETEVEFSLKNLSVYLFKHFNQRCFVIVDEYDSVCFESMFKVDEETLTKIIKFYTIILDRLLNNNETNVRSGFITGVSYMCTTGLSELNNIAPCKFLQNEKFYSFYGLTLDEVEDLRQRFSLKESEFQNLVEYYNGYQYDGKEIFNIWSVVSYLECRKISHYWKKSGAFTDLTGSLKMLKLHSQIQRLLNPFDNTLEIELYEQIRVDQIIELKKMLTNPNINLVDTSLHLNFLLEQGYFSVCEIDQNNHKVVIKFPNNEIRLEIRQMLTEFVIRTYMMPRHGII